MKKVSVIMGIYNCETTLKESIESLLNQTFQDFEVILCDDGSIDRTYEIALEYANKYSNIILLKNDVNMGLNATLNKCLSKATGEYIARQDGDDVSLSHRFKVQVDFLDNNKDYALVSSPMIYFDERGDYKRGRAVEIPSNIDFVHGSPFCHAPSMVRHSVFKLVNGYTEHRRLLRVEDYHLWFKIYSHGYKGYNIQEPLYKMRDDRNAFARRKLKYRINEMYVKYIGYRMISIPLWKYFFILRPLIVGLLPYSIYNYFHKRKN